MKINQVLGTKDIMNILNISQGTAYNLIRQAMTTKDMFVVTPEGNRFKFDYPTYTEEHEEVTIVDPWSHKTYIVVFNE